MKKISIVIPTYNEQDNIGLLVECLKRKMKEELSDYIYDVIIIDNDSKDDTRKIILELCKKNKNVRAIFNSKNFGQFNSPYYGLCQATGDCAILLCADFQDPLDVIPKLVAEWENGYRIVCGVKSKSKENPFLRFLRTCYYKSIKRMSNVEIIEHFTGFGLYDKSFLDIMRDLDDPSPFLRGVVAEFGSKIKLVHYLQEKRRAGKSSFNLLSYYDAAMLSITDYTKAGMRISIFLGFFCSIVSFLVALTYLILKLLFWDRLSPGISQY